MPTRYFNCFGLYLLAIKLKINNPQTVTLPSSEEIKIIPDSSPIIAVYQEFSAEKNKVLRENIVVVGTITDLERWFLDAKKTIRIIMNMSISILSVFLGLFIHFSKKPKPLKATPNTEK